MTQKTLAQAVKESAIALQEIHSHMSAAQALWQTIAPEAQRVIIDSQSEDKGLAHALRWGEVSSGKLIEQSGLASRPIDESALMVHAMSLREGVGNIGICRVVEALQVGGVELYEMLVPTAKRAAWIEHALYEGFPEEFTDVFLYQVTEALGQEIGDYVVNGPGQVNGELPTEDWVHTKLAQLCLKFVTPESRNVVLAALLPYLPLAEV